jgi:hypothetical protein
LNEVIAMLKSLITGACLVLLLGGCGLTKPAPDKSAQAAVKPPAGCVAQTGTALNVPANACTAFGNTYTREDLERTGHISLAGGLRTLDPAITISH